MTQLIKNWEELSKVPANDKYRIIVNDGSGWIVPICDKKRVGPDFICNCDQGMDINEYYKHHVYLSTHTFYGSQYQHSTKVLQEHGFDIEIDNWDTEE